MAAKITCTQETHDISKNIASMLIAGNCGHATKYLETLKPIQAIQAIIAATRRIDSVIGDRELDELGEYLGVFEIEGIDNRDNESLEVEA